MDDRTHQSETPRHHTRPPALPEGSAGRFHATKEAGEKDGKKGFLVRQLHNRSRQSKKASGLSGRQLKKARKAAKRAARVAFDRANRAAAAAHVAEFQAENGTVVP